MTMMNKFASGAVVGAVALLASVFAWGEVFEERTEGETPTEVGADAGPTTLLEREVPIGTWSISAKVTVGGSGEAGSVRCQLRANDAIIDESSATFAGADGLPEVTTLVSQRLWFAADVTTISLVCLHDVAAPGIFIEPGASLIISGDECVTPQLPECLPGHVYEPPDAAAEATGAQGVCLERDGGTSDPCRTEEFVTDYQDTRNPDSGQGPLLDNCPRSKPYYRCTSFGYCWCSSNGRR